MKRIVQPTAGNPSPRTTFWVLAAPVASHACSMAAVRPGAGELDLGIGVDRQSLLAMPGILVSLLMF